MPIINTTDTTFQTDVIKCKTPVLVDIWAEWCAPCRAIAPVLRDIALERGDHLVIAKLNIDDNPETAGLLGVRGIPALFLYQDGELVAQRAGASSKADLNHWIDKSLAQ